MLIWNERKISFNVRKTNYWDSNSKIFSVALGKKIRATICHGNSIAKDLPQYNLPIEIILLMWNYDNMVSRRFEADRCFSASIRDIGLQYWRDVNYHWWLSKWQLINLHFFLPNQWKRKIINVDSWYSNKEYDWKRWTLVLTNVNHWPMKFCLLCLMSWRDSFVMDHLKWAPWIDISILCWSSL